MTKLIVVFRNVATAPQNDISFVAYILSILRIALYCLIMALGGSETCSTHPIKDKLCLMVKVRRV